GAREVGPLHDASAAVVRSPDADLGATLERAAAHQAAVAPEELPGAMHLALEARTAEPDVAVVVVIGRRSRLATRQRHAPLSSSSRRSVTHRPRSAPSPRTRPATRCRRRGSPYR